MSKKQFYQRTTPPANGRGRGLLCTYLLQYLHQLPGKQAGGQLRLLRGVAGSANLKEQRAVGGMLIVAGVPQQQRPHQRGVVREHLFLYRRGQPEVFYPVRMAQPAAIAAYHQ